jgi:hypothetical protein
MSLTFLSQPRRKRSPGCFLSEYLQIPILVSSGMPVGSTSGNTIPYPDYFVPSVSGALAYNRRGDHPVSAYFVRPDFYTMRSNGTRNHYFRICNISADDRIPVWPGAALTVLVDFNNSKWDEMKLAREMNASEEAGTSIRNVPLLFRNIGWYVRSGMDEGVPEDGAAFQDSTDFTPRVINNFEHNRPIMVDNNPGRTMFGLLCLSHLNPDLMRKEKYFLRNFLLFADSQDDTTSIFQSRAIEIRWVNRPGHGNPCGELRGCPVGEEG